MSSTNGLEPAPAPRARRAWSLAARLTAWYAGSAFLLILGATGFLYWALVTNLDREDDQFLAAKIHILRVVLRDRPDDVAALRQEVEWQRAARQHAAIYVRVLDADGRLIMETPGMGKELRLEVFPPAIATVEPGTGTEVWSPSGKAYRILAAHATRGHSGDATHVLQMAFDRTFEEALLADYRRNLMLVLGAALVVCAGVGYEIARRNLRPLADMAATAGRIRSTTLHERLALGGLPAELATLADTFNEMLNRLEESFRRLERFSADIAHELRTPVNNLRGEAEVALQRTRSAEEYQEVLGSSLEECGKLTRLIDSLLFLARAESPEAQVMRERMELHSELAVVCEFYEAAAHEAGITLTVQSQDEIVADLDRSLFQRAVGNLVANSLAHTSPGGTITLSVTRTDTGVCVEVADNGCGIPRENLAHVFERFYRADPVRSGASGRVGLGLALVKSIAVLHRGSVAISSEVGQGTRVRLSFPVGEEPCQ